MYDDGGISQTTSLVFGCFGFFFITSHMGNNIIYTLNSLKMTKILIIEDHTVTVECKTAIKALF